MIVMWDYMFETILLQGCNSDKAASAGKVSLQLRMLVGLVIHAGICGK